MPIQNEQELAKQVIFFVLDCAEAHTCGRQYFLYNLSQMTAHFISFILGL